MGVAVAVTLTEPAPLLPQLLLYPEGLARALQVGPARHRDQRLGPPGPITRATGTGAPTASAASAVNLPGPSL